MSQKCADLSRFGDAGLDLAPHVWFRAIWFDMVWFGASHVKLG